MEVREVLLKLRSNQNLTQDQMAERLHVTRQAVSRWETGETQPNTEMLKVISREFDVSINTLLGAPRQLFCQCCGMPLSEDSMISREPSSTKIIASGAIPTVSLFTTTSRSSSIFCFRTCPIPTILPTQNAAPFSTNTSRN